MHQMTNLKFLLNHLKKIRTQLVITKDQVKLKLTISFLSGTLDRKSSNSLFGSELHLNFFVNLLRPQMSIRYRIGIKYSTMVKLISAMMTNNDRNGTL